MTDLELDNMAESQYLGVCLCDHPDEKYDGGEYMGVPYHFKPEPRVSLLSLIEKGVKLGLMAYVNKNGDIEQLTEQKLSELLKE